MVCIVSKLRLDFFYMYKAPKGSSRIIIIFKRVHSARWVNGRRTLLFLNGD